MKQKILILLGVCALLTLTLVLILTNRGLNKRLLAAEQQLERSSNILGDLERSQSLLKESSSRVRSSLSLPPLVFNEQGEDEEGAAPEASFELAAYDAVAYLTGYNSEQEELKACNILLEDPSFQARLGSLGLQLKRSSGFSGLLEKNGELYFSFSYKDGSLTLKSAETDESFTGLPGSDRAAAFLEKQSRLQDDIFARAERLNRELVLLRRDRGLRSRLWDLDLSLVDGGQPSGNQALSLLRIDRSELIRLRADRRRGLYLMGDREFEDLPALKEGLENYLSTADLRTAAQIKDDLVREEMTALLEDPAFRQRLSDLGYTPVMEAREDNDYIYYDLNGSDGSRVGALALQKDFAQVYLTDSEDVPVRSLRSFTPDHELRYAFETAAVEDGGFQPAIPSVDGSQTFLLIGSHEHNADTMILLHSDPSAREIRMLSIPRDLYYEGRKINSIYRQFGPARLISVLSSLTGLAIDSYIAIDMYAFIDVVNILGGIDLTLNEALVDPTYKVRENGKWSTLYYPAGTHHLDGLAALRIARSRHTSSDFERSVRQQKVISALKNKAGDMNLSDMDKIYDIIQVTGKYLETNLTTADMVKYFLSFKDFDIKGQHVMNTDNILYATYTNLYRLSAEEQKAALENPDFYKGGWIVLPKGNDWSIIKSYIRNIFSS